VLDVVLDVVLEVCSRSAGDLLQIVLKVVTHFAVSAGREPARGSSSSRTRALPPPRLFLDPDQAVPSPAFAQEPRPCLDDRRSERRSDDLSADPSFRADRRKPGSPPIRLAAERDARRVARLHALPTVEPSRRRARIRSGEHEPVTARVQEHVDEGRAHLLWRPQLVRVEAIREDTAAASPDEVEGSRDPHEEALHPPREGASVVGLGEEMDVRGLKREWTCLRRLTRFRPAPRRAPPQERKTNSG